MGKGENRRNDRASGRGPGAAGRGLTLHDEALDIHLKQWQDISTACNSADQSTSICHALRPFNGSSS
jgi:hypothetical protein